MTEEHLNKILSGTPFIYSHYIYIFRHRVDNQYRCRNTATSFDETFNFHYDDEDYILTSYTDVDKKTIYDELEDILND